MKHISGRLFTVLAVLAGLAGVFAAAAPSQAARIASPSADGTSPAVALPGSAAPKLPAAAVRLGAAPATSTISFDVTLKVRDQTGLNALLMGLSDRKSPLFHHFLSPGQFGPTFGPTLAQVTAVDNALRSVGLSPGAVSANRLSIPVTASAAAIDHALGTDLTSYRMPGGRVAYANSAAPRLPASVAPLVAGVIGLNNLYQEQSLVSWPSDPTERQHQARGRQAAPDTAGPQPCAAASGVATDDGSLTANELASHYRMSPLYSLGDLGHGVRVALVEFEPNSASDIAGYESCYGITTGVNYVEVDGGAGTGAGSSEAALDIEDVAGLAPGAAIDVYRAPNNDTGNYDDYQQIVTADTDQVVSTSWGLCELYTSPNDDTSMEALFEQANSQGQTVFAASGDTGSTGCLRSGGADESAVNIQMPSSAPYVDAVGGTTIGGSSEAVWNESVIEAGAGGGGISDLWCMPAYQYRTTIPGLINADSQADSSCLTPVVHYIRQVPDVSADADPYSGYVVLYSGQWLPIGGTSAAAPLWAAIAALTDASPFCGDYGSGAAGVLPQGLYDAVAIDHSYIYRAGAAQIAEVLSDVTNGNNDYTPSGYGGGLYPAGVGDDEATGLGVPLVTGLNGSRQPSMFYPGLAALMCKEYSTKLTSVAVTSVVPRAGAAGRSATVTVLGSGFLPIAGADMAIIGSTMVAANCTTTTTCKVTLPGQVAGTVNVQISAEDFAPSPVTAADRYQYIAAPTVTSLSPARGPAKGGTKVTIHGTNFIGVASVHFGPKLGTSLKIVSATEVTVTAPAGTGTVHVTVSAIGGTSSPTSSAGKYQYT